MAAIVKANNTNALNLTTSWVGGVVPAGNNTGLWNATVTASNTVALGGNISLGGFVIQNPGGPVTINNGVTAATVTFSTTGIDLQAATQDLTVASPITIITNAGCFIRAAAGRTVTLTASLGNSGGNNLSFALNLGTINISNVSANAYTGTFSLTGLINANTATACGAASSTSTLTVETGGTLSANAPLNYSSPGRPSTVNGVGYISSPAYGAVVLNYVGTVNIGAVTLGSASYMRGTVAGTATLSSSIANTGFALTVGAASGNVFALTGSISGTGGLVVGNSSADTGTIALTTANTYQGNTTLSFGTLSLGNASALGTGTLVFNGGTLDASTGLTATNALTASADIVFTGTAALTLSGAMSLGASRTVTVNGSTLTLSGIVSNGGAGPYKLTKAGVGTLNLTNTNTYSGGTDIGGTGTVQAGAVQALGSTGTVTLTVSTATLQTLTAGFAGQNGKLTVAALDNSAGGIIKIGG